MNQQIYCTILWLTLLSISLCCQPVPTPLNTSYTQVGAEQPGTARKAATGCGFRYSFSNSYTKLDDQTQRVAIQAGFEVWTTRCRNLRILDFADASRADLLIQFADPTATNFPSVLSSAGLLRTTTPVASALQRNANGSYTILLNNTQVWTAELLTKAIAYQAGVFLGLTVSADNQSVMSPVYAGAKALPTPADSVRLNQLYAGPCPDLTVTYLPMTLPVNGPVTRTIRTDRGGPLLVTATGSVIIGPHAGSSPPEGKDTGLWGFPINYLAQWSIVSTFWNGCLLYKLNTDKIWKYCGKECTIDLGNARYTDLTFCINDLDLSDNSGAYTVTVKEK